MVSERSANYHTGSVAVCNEAWFIWCKCSIYKEFVIQEPLIFIFWENIYLIWELFVVLMLSLLNKTRFNMIKTAFTLFPMFVCLFWLTMFVLDKRRAKLVRIFLVVFFGTTFLLYLSHALFFNYEVDLYVFFDPIYTFATLAVYPLYFLYIVHLTREVHFRSVYLLLVVPALLLGGSKAALYLLMGTDEASNFVQQVLYRENGAITLSVYGDIQLFIHKLIPFVFALQLVIITLAGSRLIMQFDDKVRNYYADTEGKELRLTRLLFVIFAFLSVVSIIANVVGRAFFLPEEWLILPSVVFSVLLFAVGYIGYQQRFTAMDMLKDKNAPTYEEDLFEELEPEFVYSTKQQAELKRKLHVLVNEEKIYTRKDLRIVDLSRSLNTNRTYVSRMINQEYGKSFSELINYYRFQEAKSMLLAPEFSFLSISEIAFRAGFPSESSFYRVFKKETGMSPGDWRKVNGVL